MEHRGEPSTTQVATPRRGRPPSVSRDQVLAAALELIDGNGVEALSMRELARALGVAVGTVYACVGAKEDVLQGVADLVFSELPALVPDGEDWRGPLIRFFEDVHRLMIGHPSVARLAVSDPLLGPGVRAGHAEVFALLARAGLAEADALTLYTTLSSYTTGFVLYQVSRRRPGAVRPASMLGRTEPDLLSDAQFRSGLRAIVHNHRPTTEVYS